MFSWITWKNENSKLATSEDRTHDLKIMRLTRCRLRHCRLMFNSLCSFMWSFSQLRFLVSLFQATFFSLRCRCLFFVPFCCALRMFSKRSFGSCVQLLASSALMSLSTFLWLFLFPKVGKISKTRYQINDGVMTSFARCPLGAFRLVFDQISSFSWRSLELSLLFLYIKRVCYISAVVNLVPFR